MQNKVTQDKEFRTFCTNEFAAKVCIFMKNPKAIKELFESGGKHLSSLITESAKRSTALEHVRSALPEELARAVVTAGVKDGKLTIGVTSASWASRLRYAVEALRTPVGSALGTEILRIQIKVMPTKAV